MDCSISAPLRTRAQRWPGTSAYQTAPPVSRQIPSGKPPGRLAQGVHPCHEGCYRLTPNVQRCNALQRGAQACLVLLPAISFSWAIREIGDRLAGKGRTVKRVEDTSG
jgi:hypothetical protein